MDIFLEFLAAFFLIITPIMFDCFFVYKIMMWSSLVVCGAAETNEGR